jgi:hypothetical protein
MPQLSTAQILYSKQKLSSNSNPIEQLKHAVNPLSHDKQLPNFIPQVIIGLTFNAGGVHIPVDKL